MKNRKWIIGSYVIIASLISITGGRLQAEENVEDVYLPPLVMEFGEGLNLSSGFIRRDRMHANFVHPSQELSDGEVGSDLTVLINVYNSSEEATRDFKSTDDLSAGRKTTEGADIQFDIGEQCSFTYVMHGTVVHFRRGPFIVYSNNRDQEVDVKALKLERQSYLARLERLDLALQKWSLQDFVDMLEEHAPHLVKSELEDSESPPSPWSLLSKAECSVRLKDDESEPRERLMILADLETREFDEDAEQFARLMIHLAENDSDRLVRIRALRALRFIPWDGSIPYLSGVITNGPAFPLDQEHSDSLADEERRAYALDSLVDLQGEDALRPLLQKLRADENECLRIREKSLVFLRRIDPNLE